MCYTAVTLHLSLYHPGEKPNVTQTWQANKAWQNQWQNMPHCSSFITQVCALQAVPSPGKVAEQIVWEYFCSTSDLKVVTQFQWPVTQFLSSVWLEGALE